MKWTRSQWLLLFASLAMVVGLPLAGKWVRRHSPPRCDLDGLVIDPLYRVRVVDGSGTEHGFCCIGCASLWLNKRTDRPRAVYVIDEASGEEIDAGSAYLVHSSVVTNPVTGNVVHAFRDRTAAEEHARVFDGWMLTDDERRAVIMKNRE